MGETAGDDRRYRSRTNAIHAQAQAVEAAGKRQAKATREAAESQADALRDLAAAVRANTEAVTELLVSGSLPERDQD